MLTAPPPLPLHRCSLRTLYPPPSPLSCYLCRQFKQIKHYHYSYGYIYFKRCHVLAQKIYCITFYFIWQSFIYRSMAPYVIMNVSAGVASHTHSLCCVVRTPLHLFTRMAYWVGLATPCNSKTIHTILVKTIPSYVNHIQTFVLMSVKHASVCI